jgi:flagellar hook assembly protein FlgD
MLLLATPNPFRERVRFRGAARETWLEIRSDLGRLVRRIKAASDDFSWDGRDDNGRRLPAGLYFARLREAGKARRIRLIKLNP